MICLIHAGHPSKDASDPVSVTRPIWHVDGVALRQGRISCFKYYTNWKDVEK